MSVNLHGPCRRCRHIASLDIATELCPRCSASTVPSSVRVSKSHKPSNFVFFAALWTVAIVVMALLMQKMNRDQRLQDWLHPVLMEETNNAR